MTYRKDPNGLELWLAEHPWPAEHWEQDPEIPDSVMETYRAEGARIMFENGWMVSAVWGVSTYSDNYNSGWPADHPISQTPPLLGPPRPEGGYTREPEMAEVAVVHQRLTVVHQYPELPGLDLPAKEWEGPLWANKAYTDHDGEIELYQDPYAYLPSIACHALCHIVASWPSQNSIDDPIPLCPTEEELAMHVLEMQANETA